MNSVAHIPLYPVAWYSRYLVIRFSCYCSLYKLDSHTKARVWLCKTILNVFVDKKKKDMAEISA